MNWNNAEELKPPQDKKVLVRGLSGFYSPYDVYVSSARWDGNQWLDMAGDSITEKWQQVLEWRYAPGDFTLGWVEF